MLVVGSVRLYDKMERDSTALAYPDVPIDITDIANIPIRWQYDTY